MKLTALRNYLRGVSIMETKQTSQSFYKKLVFIYISLLLLAMISISLVGYNVSKKALDRRGEQVLKNSVEMALLIIESEYSKYESGQSSFEESQESVKLKLMGKKNEDGTRNLNQNIDLGKYGYFIIYDLEGTEVMHPSIEGENVYNVTDPTNVDFYIVKEQIDLGLRGGGFMEYSWTYPNSEKIGKKLSYGKYYSNWDWVVVATAYQKDFNSEANRIILTMLILVGIVIVMFTYIIMRYIKELIRPLLIVSKGMANVAEGKLETIEVNISGDEIEQLSNGYNHMIKSLQSANEAIQIKNNQIEYLAYYDELTKLLNIHGMQSSFEKKIFKNQKKGLLIQMKIFGLESINAAMGYDQGNNLLRLTGEFIADSVSEGYAARTSNNEFCIWFDSDDEADVINRINQLREQAKSYLSEYGFGQLINMYLSMAKYPEQGTSFDELYKKSSIAIRRAKEDKSFNVYLYEEAMFKTVENDIQMRNYLSEAFNNGDILAYYQEKVDYTTNKVVGVEALARWISKDLGFVSPAVFIPAINHLNLINEFSNYMINYVLNDYLALVGKYDDSISVSINISPSNFLNPSFYETIKEALVKYNVPGNKVILEITEDVFISDVEAIQEIIDKIHALEVKISIDDFGTGYSSLNYLMDFNVDEIKIDKSFMDKIETDEKSLEMIGYLCKIAQLYNYEIVAEGVETMSQLEKLKRTPLKVIQGYLFSKPKPLEE